MEREISNETEPLEEDDPEAEGEPRGVISFGLMRSRSAGEWCDEAKAAAPERRLLGDLWLEGELCVLFGDTGKGKSVLATQVADAVARGTAVAPFTNQTPPQKVLYFDFEMTTAQFAARYSEAGRSFAFSPNLIRVEMSSDIPDHDAYGFNNFASYFESAVIDQIEQHQAKVVVIDNITYLSDHLQSSARADHIYNRNEFQTYLLDNTRLDTSSTKRYEFAKIYSDGIRQLIKLNLQIRFL